MNAELQTKMDSFAHLIGYKRLNDIVVKTQDAAYMSSLSLDELKYLKEEADMLYKFFHNLQMTTKLLCNSIYGGLGTPSLRYFNPVVADDITGEGRDVCKLVAKAGDYYFQQLWHTDHEWHAKLYEKFPMFFEKCERTADGKFNMNQILHTSIQYCDTDSNFLCFEHFFRSLGLDPYALPTKETVEFLVYFMKNKMDPYYDKVLTKYIEGRNGENHMIFELEAIGGFAIWVAKKKYVMAKLWQDGKYVADKGGLKITGLEIKQKSASKKVKDILKVFVNTIFTRRGKIDEETFYAMCGYVRKNLSDATFDELAKSTKINNYTKYVINDTDRLEFAPKCPPQIKGAALHNLLLRKSGLSYKYAYLKDDMFIKFYYDENGTPFSYSSEYGCPVEFAPTMSVDMQLEKLMFAPIRRLVDGLIGGDLTNMGQTKVQTGFKSLLNKFKK